MKKIIRLTERDLTRIVKRTINEMEDEDFMRGADKNWDDHEEEEEEDFSDLDNTMYDGLEDEEWGQTDRGEDRLQDLIEEARDILENELGYSIEEINQMSELDMVFILSDEYDYLAYEIEELLDEEGFDTEGELGEGWDDFTQKKRYPKDYEPENYRSIPKDFFRKNLGHKIDSEGTKLSRRQEKPFDDYEDFDDEELV